MLPTKNMKISEKQRVWEKGEEFRDVELKMPLCTKVGLSDA